MRPFDALLGAEIIGLDLTRPLSDEDFARIHRAHLDHALLVFRDQRITPEQQIACSRRFGSLQIHVLRQFLLSNHPEIFIISNIIENGQPIGLGDAGKFWHSDLSYKELPSLGSMLLAQELPEEGGDTLFASQQLAYEALPAELSELGGAARIPLARQDALWEAFCTAADDPLIGLRLGCALQVGHLDMLGALLMSCETVGEALEALLEYYPIVGGGGEFSLLREPGRVCLIYRAHYQVRREERVGAVLASLLHMLRWIAGNKLGALQLSVSHNARAALSRYAELLECNVAFAAQRDGLWFADADLQVPLIQANATMREHLRGLAQSLLECLGTQSLTVRVQQLLREQPRWGKERIAEQLELSGRHLNRKLADEGTSFKLLREQVLFDMAENLLREPVRLSEVAEGLGFSDESAFAKAFRR